VKRPTLIGLHAIVKIREALTYGVSESERERMLDEISTYYRRQPDLFAQRSQWTDPHWTSRSPGLRCCDHSESGASQHAEPHRA
jgi:hypothetical protein